MAKQISTTKTYEYIIEEEARKEAKLMEGKENWIVKIYMFHAEENGFDGKWRVDYTELYK